MISRADIERLAMLSRLKLTADEMAALEKDFASILEYVGQVSAAAVGEVEEELSAVHNVMREDAAVPFAVGGSRATLMGAFPQTDGDYLAVRKVINKKK